eukprot:6191600-Pleurochrysis_carterae.AAC.4
MKLLLIPDLDFSALSIRCFCRDVPEGRMLYICLHLPVLKKSNIQIPVTSQRRLTTGRLATKAGLLALKPVASKCTARESTMFAVGLLSMCRCAYLICMHICAGTSSVKLHLKDSSD